MRISDWSSDVCSSDLSSNWLINRMVYCYVEFTRNVPVLVQILLWHGVIVTTLPHPRDALSPMEGVYIPNRGLYVPAPVFESGFWILVAALLAGLAGTILFRRCATNRQAATRHIYTVFPIGTAALLGLHVIAFFMAVMPAYIGMADGW